MAQSSDPLPLTIVLSGPSGAGKDTLIRAALKLDSSLATVATVKTRPPRPGEIDGVHHVFLSDEEFDRWLTEGELLEHVEIYGHRSGVPRAPVDKLLREGKSVILRTDVQGARTLREQLVDPLLVFVTAPDLATLERRIRHRGAESEADVARRLAEVEAELAESDWFDRVIINADDREGEAARELVDWIASERQQRARARD